MKNVTSKPELSHSANRETHSRQPMPECTHTGRLERLHEGFSQDADRATVRRQIDMPA
jgi:hypothetical protein